MNVSPKILGARDSQKRDAASLLGRFSRAKALVVMHHYVLAKFLSRWRVLAPTCGWVIGSTGPGRQADWGDGRLGLERTFAGQRKARHRRDRHRGYADQRGRGVGAVVREEMAGVGAGG